MTAFPRLFQSIHIGKVKVRNRIVMPPMCSRLSSAEGYVTKEQVDYYAARARGGVGMVVVEYAYIQKGGKSAYNQLGIYDDWHISGLSRIAEAIKMHGATAVLQVCHGGRQTTTNITGGTMPVAPSAIPCKFMSKGIGKTNYCREMTVEEIQETIESFGDAAKRAKAAGFDGMEFHGAHGYLLASFLSPYTNKRTDLYGGSLENRALIGLEAVRNARSKVGDDFLLQYRLSADEFIDGGLTLEESKVFTRMIEKEGINSIHVSGTNFETIHYQEPPLYLESGNLIHLAEEIKAGSSVPIIGVGGIVEPHTAERYLMEGRADMIAMGRALIADPELPNKAFQGRLEEIIPCVRCNEGCINNFFKSWPQRCSVNPITGREADFSLISRTENPKTVSVVGGGPAGMQAAITAAEKGHFVTLYEKNKELGGNLIPASKPSFKQDLTRLLEYLKKKTESAGIEVKVSTEVNPELLAAAGSDVIIIATGADLFIPDLEGISAGIEKGNVITALEVLTEAKSVGEDVVVVGGGMVGCETALHIAGKGKKVSLIEATADIATDLEPLSRTIVIKDLEKLGVNVLCGTTLQEITTDGAIILGPQGKDSIKTETIVLALGSKGIQDDKRWSEIDGNILFIGDCNKPGKIMDAIHNGFILSYYL